MEEVINPKITVIVPNYNHSRFLIQRMDSIFGQTLRDFEVIILDDASIDDSRTLIEQWRNLDKVKSILYNENNSGSPFLQWQKGIDIAESEWIWIAESDDYCTPQLLESLLPAFSNPDCVLAYVEVDEVDEKGNLVLERRTGMHGMVDGSEFIKKHLILRTALVNSGMVLLRRSAVLAAGDGYTRFKLCGDYWLHYHIALQGKVFAAGSRQAFFRRHPKEVTAKYLYTRIFYDEMLSIFNMQIKSGFATATKLIPLIEYKLHSLYCIRKGISKKDYSSDLGYWLGLVEQYGLKISRKKIYWKANISKSQHLIKRVFSVLRLRHFFNGGKSNI